jgi:hypothetical protein
MKHVALITIVSILTFGATLTANASLIRPEICRVAITGHAEPLILKLEQFPAKLELVKFNVREFSYKSLIFSEIVFRPNLSNVTIN